MLLTLLEDSKKSIQENEAEHIQEIRNLSKSYERRLSVHKIVGGSLVGVIIIGAVYMIIVQTNRKWSLPHGEPKYSK